MTREVLHSSTVKRRVLRGCQRVIGLVFGFRDLIDFRGHIKYTRKKRGDHQTEQSGTERVKRSRCNRNNDKECVWHVRGGVYGMDNEDNQGNGPHEKEFLQEERKFRNDLQRKKQNK